MFTMLKNKTNPVIKYCVSSMHKYTSNIQNLKSKYDVVIVGCGKWFKWLMI